MEFPRVDLWVKRTVRRRKGNRRARSVRWAGFESRVEVLEGRALLSFVPPISGTPRFSRPIGFDVGQGPNSVVVADFNRDGVPDIASANGGADSVSILLGRGNGRFLPAIDSPAGKFATSITTADFNRDGKPDLAVSNFSLNTVSILLGKGDGTFQAPISYGAGAEPVFVTAGDLNRDGIPDLVTANIAGSPSVGVLLGKGDGTFQDVKFIAAGANPISLAIADVNRDGVPDLLVTYSASSGPSADSVGVLLGNRSNLGNASDVTFGSPQFFRVGTTSR